MKNQRGKNVKNSLGNFLEKNVEKIGVKKTWINDLEEVKSVEKCQCGKKSDKFPWKNITYLVVNKSAKHNPGRKKSMKIANEGMKL